MLNRLCHYMSGCMPKCKKPLLICFGKELNLRSISNIIPDIS